MDQMTIEAIIFMVLGWTFVLFLAIFPMVKILSSKISYKKDD